MTYSIRAWDRISIPAWFLNRGLHSLQLVLGGEGVLGSGPSLGKGSAASEPTCVLYDICVSQDSRCPRQVTASPSWLGLELPAFGPGDLDYPARASDSSFLIFCLCL